MNQKELAFEHFLVELMRWNMEYKDLKEFDYRNDLSLLKTLKLLFFTVALDSEKSDSLLDNVFDKFYAMPLGPVELDIYDLAKNENLHFFRLDRYKLSIKGNQNTWQQVVTEINACKILNTNIKAQITNAVSNLKSAKKSLIKQKAFDLVELSHSYNSWITTYNTSFSNIAYINPSLIKKDYINLETNTF